MSQRLRVAILRSMRDSEGPVSSSAIARGIQQYGFDVSARTIRQHLEELEAEGLVTAGTRGRGGGRQITEAGAEEVDGARVLDRVGLTLAKVDAMACGMTFEPSAGRGLIVLNVSTVDRRVLPRVFREMAAVFGRGLGMGRRVTLFPPGDRIGGYRISEGRIGIGTVCSMSLNGILLASRIPVVSRFAGVLELEGGVPARFTDVIYYDGTSLDPLQVFIKGGLLRVIDAARSGNGRIGASFREVPTCALDQVRRILVRMASSGLGEALLIGRPNQPVLGMPVQEGRTGLVVPGGLNPVAAVEEAGIATENRPFSCLFPYEQLMDVRDLAAEMGIVI
jgi:repressor of nif and glnA expression